jgi:predicted nucleic acid-binding protein
VILVDTSVWVDHLRRADRSLAEALAAGLVLVHPFVIGELACGVLPGRAEVLHLLHELPFAAVASPAEALGFIDRHALAGRGVGYVDVHLLASARIPRRTVLWTRDRRLAAIAGELGVGHAAALSDPPS